MSNLHLFLVTYLGLHSLALPVLAHSGISLWHVNIFDEGSLPEIALSDASKLASTYFSLFYRSVHVLYTEIIAKSRVVIEVTLDLLHNLSLFISTLNIYNNWSSANCITMYYYISHVCCMFVTSRVL